MYASGLGVVLKSENTRFPSTRYGDNNDSVVPGSRVRERVRNTFMISGSSDAAARYYRALTSLYQWYGGTAHGWHYGVYDAGAASHAEALVRSNEILLRGIDRSGGCRVLDVGCGEGGFSIWAAHRGYRALGLTVVAEHAAIAQTRARLSGVGDRCDFMVMDMDALGLRADSCDVVINQETLCHSRAKPAYLANVLRVLRPGGRFRAVDLALRGPVRNAREERRYQRVRDGFEVPSLVSQEDLPRDLEMNGFTDIVVTDLTEQVRRTTWLILIFTVLPHLASIVGVDRWTYARERTLRHYYRRHAAACMAFNIGLLRGPFCYLSASARKPLDPVRST